MKHFILGIRSEITKVRSFLIEAASEKGHGSVGLLLCRYVVRVALLVGIAAASFAAGMLVMEASSRTGNYALYFAIAVLVSTGSLLLAALLSYGVLAGMVGRRMRSSRIKTNP